MSDHTFDLSGSPYFICGWTVYDSDGTVVARCTRGHEHDGPCWMIELDENGRPTGEVHDWQPPDAP